MGTHVKSRYDSMLTIGGQGTTTTQYGFPRQPYPLRMYMLSLGLLLLFSLCISGTGACTPCLSQCNCVRVDSNSTNCAVDCSNSNLKSILRTDFPSASKWIIVKLNLSRNSIHPTHSTFNDFTDIQSLDLAYNGITSLDSTTFTLLTDLEELILSGNEIQSFSDKSFEINGLKTLDLSSNPVTGFGRYMFTSTSTITALYINNLKLTSLPEYMFQNLKKLQVLYAHGNQINYIHKDALKKNKRLTVFDVSNNYLPEIDKDTFDQLDELSSLNLAYNNLTYLDPDLFSDMASSLTSLNVAYNPWNCTCSLKSFRDYLVNFKSSGGQLLNENNITCSASPGTSFMDSGGDKFWSCLCSKHLPACTCWGTCNEAEIVMSRSKRDLSNSASSYVSCFSDEEAQTKTTISFSEKSSAGTLTTELECTEMCFQSSLPYALFVSNICLCGSVSTYDCSCNGNSYTSSQSITCSGSSSALTYLPNVYKVYSGLTFDPIPPLTAGESTTIVARVNLTNINMYIFTFGDSSTTVTKGATSKSYSITYTYPVPGKYQLTAQVCVGTACDQGSVTVIVQPPSTLVKTTMSGDTYVNTTARTTISASVSIGNNFDLSWARTPSDGITGTSGVGCTELWDMYRGRCLLKGATTKTYDDATTECSTNSLVHHLSSQEEVSELATLYSSVTNIYLEAKKHGIFYKWKNGDYAFFSASEVTDSSSGDCVVIATGTLKGVDCNTAYGFACQKIPDENCPYGGSHLNSYCYVLKTAAANWDAASTSCQAITSNARLAVVNSASIQSHMTSNVVGTAAWVGLSDKELEGYPAWVTGESLYSYNPLTWVPEVDCFTLDSSGAWTGYSCNTVLPYVCEYSVVNEKVDVNTYVAGTAALDPTDNSYTLETLTSTTITTSDFIVATVLPGLWFSYSGTLHSWHFVVEPQTSAFKLKLQVFRPECPTAGESLLNPECNGEGGRFASCKTTSATCTASTTCAEGKQWCYLDNSCKPKSDPCNCNTVVASKCSTFFEGSEPQFTLVGETAVLTEVSTTEKVYRVEADDIDVMPNDIIGFSVNSGSNVIKCDTGAGNWSQNGRQKNHLDWIAMNSVFTPSDWKNDTSCFIQAIYSPSATSTSPASISYFPVPGSYQFQASIASPAVTQSHSVIAEEEIGTIFWVYPALQSSGLLYLEQGLPEMMVIGISSGSSAKANWTISSSSGSTVTAYTTSFESSCPTSASYTGLSDSCDLYLNWPEKPFSNQQHAFSISKEGVNPIFDVKVYNDISSKTLSLNLKLFIPLGGVKLSLKTPNTNNYVDYLAATVFETSLSTGSPTLYTFSVNNTEVSSGFSNEFTYNFTAFESYKISVNASDELNWGKAETTVTVRIKANLANLALLQAPTVLVVNKAYEYALSVDVTVGAAVTVKWNFGASTEQSVVTATSASLSSSLNYTYVTTGSYSLAVSVKDEFDDEVTQTIPIEVVEEIASVSLSASSAVVATGTETIFTPSLPSVTGSYGTVYFSYDFKDGNTAINKTNSTEPYTYTSVGVYNVEVTASNGASSQTASVQVTAEDAITNLAIGVTTPVLLHTDVTLTATTSAGSNVAYVFEALGATSPSSNSNQYILNFTTVGVYPVKVTATNLLGSETSTLNVHAVTDSTLEIYSISHDQYVAKSESVTIEATVLHKDTSSLTVTWQFGDGSSPVKGTGLLQTSHTFSTVGAYNTTLYVQDITNGRDATGYSEIQIQEKLTDLSVTSSGNGKIESGAAATVTLTSQTSTGSSLGYTWSHGTTTVVSSSSTYDLIISDPGTVLVNLTVANQVSSLNTSVSVIFQNAVEGVSLDCLNCIQDSGQLYLETGTAISVTANVTSGTDVLYTYLFESSAPTMNGHSQTYNYSAAGNYNAQVNVSNLVSSSVKTLSVEVQDRLSNFHVTSFANAALIGYTITITTSIEGSNPIYTWKWCGTCAEFNSSSGSTDVNITTFGDYVLTVTARNALNSVSLTKDLYFYEPITDIYLTSPDLLNISNTLYIAQGGDATLTATADKTRGAYYSWKIINPLSISTDVPNAQTTSYNFGAVGQYTVRMTSYNGGGTFSKDVLVNSVEAITSPSISANSSSPLATGSGVQLTASATHGTFLSFKWSLDSQELTETSNQVSISFPSNGKYVVTVNISNPVGEESTSVEYTILDVVDGISIILPSSNAEFYPYLIRFTYYTFSANVTQGDDYSVQWELRDTGLQKTSTGTTFGNFYTSSNNYTVHMTVSNAVSSKKTSTVFSIQTKITSLSLQPSATIGKTGDTIIITVNKNIGADYLSYVWTINTQVYTTTTDSFTQVFSSPGVYNIHLRVYNMISEVNATTVVTIQDLITDIAIHGCDAIVNVTNAVEAIVNFTTGTDVDLVWTTTLTDGSSLTQNGNKFAFSFMETEVYTLSLNASNLVDSKHLTCQYTVIGVISDVVINMSSSVYFVDYTVVFKVTGRNLVGVTYDWSISPLNENSSSTSNVLNKVFTTKGTYTITMKVYHSINSVTRSETFFIDKLKCNAHVLTPGGETSRTIMKSQSVIFEVTVDSNDCKDYDLIYRWQVFSAASCSVPLTTLVSLDGLATNRPKLTVSNGTFDYGDYCVLLYTEYEGTPLVQNVTFTLSVIRSALVAVISSGSRRTMPENTDMKLDATPSFDPDYSSSLSYHWTCSVTGGSGNACNSLGNSQSITLSGSDLVSGETYTFDLTVSATGRTSGTTSTQLIISSSDIPVVYTDCLTCAATDSYRYRPDEPLKLKGGCSNCDSVTDISYLWSAVYDNSGTPVAFNLDSSNTNTGVTKHNLVINANVLTPGKTFTFTLTVVRTVNQSVTTSSSALTLQPNLGLVPGSCSGTTTPITALEQLVNVSCSGFTDPDGISTELHYIVKAFSTDADSQGDNVILYYGTRSSIDIYVAPWPGVSRSTVLLKVYVQDERGSRLEGLSLTVSFTPPVLAFGVTKVVNLQSMADDKMIALVKENSPHHLVDFSIAMVQELNEESRLAVTSNDTEAAYRATLRNVLTLTAVGLPMESIQEHLTMAFFLKQITAYPSEFQNSNCQNLVLDKAQKIKTFMDNIATQGLDHTDFSPDSLLETVSNAMAAVNMAVYSSSSLTLGYFNASMQIYIASISDLTDVFTASSTSEETHRKAVVTSAFALAEDIIAVNLKMQIVGEPAVELRLHNKMRIYGVRSLNNELYKEYITNSSSVVVQDTMLVGIAKEDEVFQIYLVVYENPYSWGLFQGVAVSTRLVSLTITDTTGAGYAISGLSDDKKVKMVLASTAEEITLTNGSLIGAPEYNPQKNMKLSSVTVEEGSPKIVNLDTSSGFTGASLHVQVTYNVLTDKAPAGTTPNVGVKIYLGKDITKPEPCSYSDFKDITEAVSSSDHRLFTFYVGDFSLSSKYKVSIFNNDTNYPINATVGIYFTSCQYYDKTNALWDNAGTSSSEESIATVAVCSANHLTAFSGSILVPSDAISFENLTFEDILSNPVVFITCGIVLAVYIVAVILCRRMDVADIERISSVPLCGKDGSFKYEVTVITGRQRGAGTSAHVGIKLYGDYGKSKPRHLSKKDAFQRNCQDTFIIAHDTNLGNIDKIQIWHDNHGMNSSWYLVQVILRDLQTDSKYYFFANCWFSLEMEYGFIEKEIRAAGSSEIKRFGRMFSHAVSTSMADRHLWVSIFDRPAQSRFTRVQRATCIVTLLYTFMCVNVIWYGVLKQEDAGSSEGISSFGWEEVVVALVTNACVIPFSLILINIFKKSRSKSNVFDQGKRSNTAQTIEIDNACDNSEYNSFRTNDDLLSYLDRESTTESMATAADQPTLLGLRRTKTLKTSHIPHQKPPSTADSTTSYDKSTSLRRTNNPGKWRKDSFIESWQSRLPGNSSEGKGDDKDVVHEEAKEAADEIMQYLDDIETEELQREAKKTKITGGILQRPTIMKRTSTRGSLPPDSASSEKRSAGGLKKRMSTLSVTSSKTSTSRKQFNPREDPVINEKKPKSPGSVKKWVNKLKNTVSTDSIGTSKQNTMPEVERIGPLEPDLMLSRQQSQPDIVHRGMHSFSMDLGSRRRSGKCTLPAWCVYLSYILCFILCVVSVIITMLYGYQFGADIALQWVLALLFSMVLSIIIFEPLKALFIALWLSAIEKKTDPYEEDDIIDIEPSVDNSVERIKETKFKPLKGFALLNAKEDGQKIQRMRLMLRQFCAYMFYLWIILVLCYVNFSSSIYTFSSNTDTVFIQTNLPDSNYSIQNITSIDQFWNWTQTVLAEGLHGIELETNQEYGDLLGIARLRQIRSITETCVASSAASSLSASSLTSDKTCVGSEGYKEDEATYGEAWTSAQNASWRYYSGTETGSKRRLGNVHSYSGGGYIQMLGTTYNETINILQDLQAKDWITLRTRAVFVDFTLYNPATDLSTTVNILVELPMTGSVNTSYDIQTQKLLRFISGVVEPLMVCQSILFFVIIYLLVHIALMIKENGCKTFLTKWWNLYEIFTTLLAILQLSLYIGCVIEATITYQQFFSDYNSFINFERASDLHIALRYTQAWLLFLLMFKVVKQLRFIKFLYMYEKTLSTSLPMLMGAGLIFMILFLVHGMFAYLLYGPYVGGFESYWASLTSLTGMIRGTFDFWPMMESQAVFTHIFFYSYYCLVYGLTIGLVVAILTDAYKTVRSHLFFKSTMDVQDHEMVDFMLKRFKLWAGFSKPKPSFRRVHFQGEPSISSRCTSSYSTRSFENESLGSSEPSMLDPPTNIAGRLTSTWEEVLRTMDKVTVLDDIEEDLIKKTQKGIDEWKWQNRIQNLEKERQGLLSWAEKPPTNKIRPSKVPHATFKDRRSTVTANSEGGASKTPPTNSSGAEKPPPSRGRPLSDQGGRAQPAKPKDRMSVYNFFKSLKPSKPAW